MCEFNVLINAPLMGMSLYERTNRKEDCEGLILGSYRRVTKSNVDDTADRSDFIEHELIIRRLPICGVRGTFYDQTCQIDFTKLNGLLKTELGLNDDENDVEKLELLGWFISRRVFSPEFLNVYREISKSLNEAKCWLTADKKESLQFSYGGPLFLCIYERFLNGEEKFKYDVQECKYQMYCYQSISDQLKSIKLKIVNVGDTSHVDYEAINVGLNLHNATNSPFSYVPKSMLENLTPELEKTAIDLAQNSKKLIADEIERLEIVEKRLNGIQNGNGADCSVNFSTICVSKAKFLNSHPVFSKICVKIKFTLIFAKFTLIYVKLVDFFKI